MSVPVPPHRENNMVNAIGSFDLGKERVSSLNQHPDGEELVLPALYFELDYTPADTRTQFYVGNQTADYLSFDPETTLETEAGVRRRSAGLAPSARHL